MKFEDKMKRLEEIIDQMETAKKPLDEMISLFKEGLALSKECKKELAQLELDVQRVIAEQEDGTIMTETMDVTNE